MRNGSIVGKSEEQRHPLTQQIPGLLDYWSSKAVPSGSETQVLLYFFSACHCNTKAYSHLLQCWSHSFCDFLNSSSCTKDIILIFFYSLFMFHSFGQWNHSLMVISAMASSLTSAQFVEWESKTVSQMANPNLFRKKKIKRSYISFLRNKTIFQICHDFIFCALCHVVIFKKKCMPSHYIYSIFTIHSFVLKILCERRLTRFL